MKQMIKTLFRIFAIGGAIGLLIVILMSPVARASSFTCPSAGIFNELIGGICWSQLFPISISGTTMFGGNGGVPDNTGGGGICSCDGSLKKLELPRVGFTLGMWQPTLLVSAISHPFCFPSLDGTDIGGEDTGGIGLSGSWGGTKAASGTIKETHQGYYNAHILTFPLLWMMNIFNVPLDNGTGYNGMDVLLQSEFYPTWNDPLLAMLESPEEILYAGPVGMVAEAGECVHEFAGGKPIDPMYFTAGCWGLLYPMVGNNLVNNDPIRTSSLDATRLIALGFRLGFMRRSMGKSVVCGPRRTYVLPKQQYKLQLLYPVDETSDNPNQGVPKKVPQKNSAGKKDGVNIVTSPVMTNGCTHWIGQSPFQWGESDVQPGSGSDYVYLAWQWTNGCLGVLSGLSQGVGSS